MTFRRICLAVLALIAAAVPIAAYSGYYAPDCGFNSVWTLSGTVYQYVCY
jgi:hypothetical protein